MSPFYLQLSTFVLPLFIGVILLVASKYTRIPNIILLLVGGVLLGPEFFGLVDPKSTGEGLKLIISMCVAVILFEGGLTLHRDGIKKATTVIWRLLTIGVLITWLGTAAVIHFIMGYPISMSLAAGSLVIVTGPTVIAPLLKRIQIKENLYHILHWEGVLIDPIGVFIAILCFEWISIEGGFLTHVWHLGLRAFAGVVIGFAGGWIISVLLKQEIIPEKQGNIFVFSSALFLFGLSDFIIHESGILTVVVAGLVVGWANPPMLKYIQQFKSDLTDLAIALVFILLAANLDLWQFLILGWEMLLILGCVLFLIRPLSIFFCTFGSQLVTKEKLFLSWIAPRGVVAGSMASLYGLQLVVKDYPNALFFETFTFSVIAATIILQGGSAGIFAKWLQVKQLEKKGWLIVGAHQFSKKVADFISKTTKGTCVIVDTNADAVKELKKEGIISIEGNALSTDVLPPELGSSIGNLLALTDNRDLNHLICEKWSEYIDKKNLYRWTSQSMEIENQIGGMGKPVWAQIQKPSKMAFELKKEEIFFNHLQIEEYSAQINPASVLLTQNHGQLFFQ
ncbi:MAG: cation:proton antiporter, partial [Deltaproteobacteria bacterium]|nr:cation:proton antiporter [Deltaproteobacteria bacterium]